MHARQTTLYTQDTILMVSVCTSNLSCKQMYAKGVVGVKPNYQGMKPFLKV